MTATQNMLVRSRAAILTVLFATLAVSIDADEAAQVQTMTIQGGSSSGWVDFTLYTNLGIFFPVKINGHEVVAWLYGGPSNIDKSFATSIGINVKTDAASSLDGVELQVGALTLKNASARPGDLQAEVYAKIIGHAVPFRLGKEVFNHLAVDIDFAHHRIAFRDPKSVTKPAGAAEVPLIELDGERVVPLSVNGESQAQFELELGNVIGPLLVTPAFAQSHKLLDGHPTSKRKSGPFSETVVCVDHLGFAGVDFPGAPIALIPDTELPPASITGGVGLPLLAKFNVIIDYSHNRLFATPNAQAAKPIEKDRIGLILVSRDSGFLVVFVSPDSPAAAAGFKAGEKIALIDGKAPDAWPPPAVYKFQMADAGTTHAFTMSDGTVRQVKAADFF